MPKSKLLCAAALLSSMLGLPMAANAADLGVRPPPPAPVYAPPPPFSWTGFYIGGNLGAGWNHGNVSDSNNFFNLGVDNSTTFVGGGQVGGNYQFNNLVVGVEADFDWFANNNNSGGGTPFSSTVIQGSNNGRWLTTLAGRFGFAADHYLFYGKGGAAWVGSNNLTLLNVPTGATVSFSNGNTNTGWLAGAGVEWAFANNWTGKLEYDYVGLSGSSFTVPGNFVVPALQNDVFSTSNRNVQTVTVGINYLFH